MIVNIDYLTSDKHFDVCIIGSGPAGLTVALKLMRRGKKVLVLEAGDRDFSTEQQNLYTGENAGDPYLPLDACRLRQFGGTSNHWSGWCRPLDEIDMEFKHYSQSANWPISKSDLDPYLPEAKAILNLAADWPDRDLGYGVQEIQFQWSEPVVRFGEKFEEEIKRSPQMLLALNCPVVSVELEAGLVKSLTVKNLKSSERKASADNYVLACGGIENNRLLLHWNSENRGRLINNADTLGRYWMEHPHFTIGEAFLESDQSSTKFFGLTPSRQRELEILNCGLRLQPIPQNAGFKGALRDLACVAPSLGTWLYEQLDRKLVCFSQLRAAWEQEPNYQSRIRLSQSKSCPLGIPLPVLEWRKTWRDMATVRLTAIELGGYLRKSNTGSLRLLPWVLGDGDWPENDEIGGNHHMGGTRMSASPDQGIVDSQLRLWDQKNMYVAGSSVFPSGGHANPTLTIVQLSLRLADQLSRS